MSLRILSRMPPRVAQALGAVAILLAVSLAVVALVQMAGGARLRAFEQHLADSDTGPLDTTMVAQSFVSPRDNLSRIDLQLTELRSLPGSGRVWLVRGDGPDAGPAVREMPLASASFAGNPFLSISFPPIQASAGVTYTLVVETPGQRLGDALSARFNSFDALSSGRMYTDAGAEEGDLALFAFYSYSPADALSEFVGGTTASGWAIAVWALLLVLPGLALLSWLPSGLSAGQRALAAPGVSALALPLFYLITRAVGLPFGTVGAWLLLLLCAAAIVVAYVRYRPPVRLRAVLSGANIAFWVALGLVFALTLFFRLLSLRDAVAGMGLDAYHHTLISQMFVQAGGVPSNYQPFAPLSSFTYHYGFHALAATVAWLLGATSSLEVLALVPVVGQVVTALPVLTLALFGWRALNNRWAGLAAGALAGLVSVFPAYYVNWSRYTQGMGLALLPVAWVLALEVLDRAPRSGPVFPRVAQKGTQQAQGGQEAPVTWQFAIGQSGPYMLAVIGGAGLFLTHYRIAIIYAGLVGLYVVGRLIAAAAGRRGTAHIVTPLRRVATLAVLTLAALSPWLVNLQANFRTHLVGRDTAEARGYYATNDLWMQLWQPPMLALALLAGVGLVVALARRQWGALLPAVMWALVGLWSSPYLFEGIRLPFAGYLDINTWGQSIWVPLALLGGVAVEWVVHGAASLAATPAAASSGGGPVRSASQAIAAGVISGALLVGACWPALATSTQVDSKPYLTQADLDALVWMRDNLPKGSYVLANPFAFTWAPRNVLGSDAGMWAPLVSGLAATVPPVPTYNEQLSNPGYMDDLFEILPLEPWSGQPANWQGLRAAGVTHVFVGSRGGALDVPAMLKSDFVRLLWHRDAVWVFEIR